MPIFEYRCNACGHEFEFLMLPASTATAACPECHATDLEKMPTGFAVSSDALTRARVKAARVARRNSKDYKDEQIAEAEHIREHVMEHQEQMPNTKS